MYNYETWISTPPPGSSRRPPMCAAFLTSPAQQPTTDYVSARKCVTSEMRYVEYPDREKPPVSYNVGT